MDKKTDDIKFSILIPAYNASDVISDTLDSVRGQTYKNFEVIIVDDGSKDETKKVINEYKKQYPEMDIKYFWQENGGASSARYRCGKEASGDYIAFLDADDFWYDKKLERIYYAIEHYNADVYYHDEIEVWKDGTKNNLPARDLSDDPLSDLVINGNAMATSAAVVKTDIYRQCDPFYDKKRAGEDYECWIRLAAAGARFYHVCETLGEYRRNENGLTLINNDWMMGTFEESIRYFDYLDKNKFSEQKIEYLKKKKVAYNTYLMGRHYHRKREYREAKHYYIKSIRQGNITLKCIAGLMCAIIKKYV
ncbi:MAG: glycosyltransferase family 2 protein [Lachnospiraceae bacterium]|nr:glycosyltransferase family 2 protein [Lachnospiraceae bacterium]